MALDDHEIKDDWGTAPLDKDPAEADKRLKAGLEAYRIFQQSHNPGGYEGPLHYSFTRGPASFFVMDSRSGRNPKREGSPVVDPDQLRALKDWAASDTTRASDIIFLVTPVPFAFIPVEDVRNLLEEISGDAGSVAGFLVGALTGIPFGPVGIFVGAAVGTYIGHEAGERLSQKIYENKLIDLDIADMWAHAPNQPDLVRVLDCLFDLANDIRDGNPGPRRRAVFVLGGDVHSGSIHIIRSSRTARPHAHRANAIIHQVISSPISNLPVHDELYKYAAKYIDSRGPGGLPLPIGGTRWFNLDSQRRYYSAVLTGLVSARNFGRVSVERTPEGKRVYRIYLAVEAAGRALRQVLEIDLDSQQVTPEYLSLGLGLLAYRQSLTSLRVHPEGRRLGSWLYSSADRIAGLADFDGDGRSEVLITSGWGIGLLKQQGDTFGSPLIHPVGTRFGGWLYSSADRIAGLADFDGDGRSEVLITSGWGIGLLKQQGDTFASR
jgi:hypothetical protein